MHEGWSGMKTTNFFRSLTAITIILIGLALILANIGIISWSAAEAWHIVYPSFFILFGLKWCWDGIRGKGGLYLGSFLVIFGGLLLSSSLNLLDFSFLEVYKLWPLLLIYFGFQFFGSSQDRKRKKKFQFIFDSENDEAQSFSKTQKFAVGDHKFSGENWKVEPMELWNAVGDYHIDFTKAFIPDKEIPISIQGWAGDIRVLMPENLEFTIEAHVKAGDINVFGHTNEGVNRQLLYETENFQTATRKLNLYMNLKAGAIRVDKV